MRRELRWTSALLAVALAARCGGEAEPGKEAWGTDGGEVTDGGTQKDAGPGAADAGPGAPDAGADTGPQDVGGPADATDASTADATDATDAPGVDTPDTADAGPPAGATRIGPEGGIVERVLTAGALTRARLVIPPGALDADVDFTIEPYAALPFPGGAPVLGAVEVAPTGTLFAVPATLEVQYDEGALAAAGMVEETLGQILVWVDDPGIWLPPGETTVDPTANVASVPTSHLTPFAFDTPTLTPDPKVWKGPFASTHPPVILVHGWQADEDIDGAVEWALKALFGKGGAGTWGKLAGDGLFAKETDPLVAFELSYYTGGGIEEPKGAKSKPCVLAWAVHSVLANPAVSGAGHDTVTLLAHSMGGLVSRAYIQTPDLAACALPCAGCSGADRVERLVTLGTPHGGSVMAQQSHAAVLALAAQWPIFGLAFEAAFLESSVADMLPGSAFLKKPNTAPPPLAAKPGYHAVRGGKDTVVTATQASLRLALGLPDTCDASEDIAEYLLPDAVHSPPLTGVKAGEPPLVFMEATTHPSYPIVCRLAGATSGCGCSKGHPVAACQGPGCLPVCPGSVFAAKVVCDLPDGDCDGAADPWTTQVGAPCTAGTGACEGSGAWACGSGGLWCTAVPFPPTTESCNGVDDDCDGETDEPDAVGCLWRFPDQDGDGFGTGGGDCVCGANPPGYAPVGGDCNDKKGKVYPGAPELCDGIDNDCDKEADEDCPTPCTDSDGDGYGAGFDCAGPSDCDDTRPETWPGAPELCDGLDNDCDSDPDDGNVCAPPPYTNPADGDTTGVEVSVAQVETVEGYAKIKLYAQVSTQSGARLKQLTAGNFTITETVAGQPLSVPIQSAKPTKSTASGANVALLIDSSGSMGSPWDPSSWLGQAKTAAKQFVSKLKPQDMAAVVEFASSVAVNAWLTNDKLALFAAIDACDEGTMTSMYDALLKGIDIVKPQKGQRAVVLLSDGEDNDSACGGSCSPNTAIAPALAAGTPIYTIGLGASQGSGLEADLIAIANGTFAGKQGAGYYPTVDAAGLQTIYDDIATVLANVYVVSWYTAAKPGQTVNVTIQVTYKAAKGTFTDSFQTSFVVPKQCTGGACSQTCPKQPVWYACPPLESMVMDSPDWCRHYGDTGEYDHKGACYREVVNPPGTLGQQCCYTAGKDNCTGSPDLAAPAEGKWPAPVPGLGGLTWCNFDAAAACKHCALDVLPFCHQHCESAMCEGPAILGCGARKTPSACNATAGCDWKYKDCGGVAGDGTAWYEATCGCPAYSDPASCDEVSGCDYADHDSRCAGANLETCTQGPWKFVDCVQDCANKGFSKSLGCDYVPDLGTFGCVCN